MIYYLASNFLFFTHYYSQKWMPNHFDTWQIMCSTLNMDRFSNFRCSWNRKSLGLTLTEIITQPAFVHKFQRCLCANGKLFYFFAYLLLDVLAFDNHLKEVEQIDNEVIPIILNNCNPQVGNTCRNCIWL